MFIEFDSQAMTFFHSHVLNPIVEVADLQLSKRLCFHHFVIWETTNHETGQFVT